MTTAAAADRRPWPPPSPVATERDRIQGLAGDDWYVWYVVPFKGATSWHAHPVGASTAVCDADCGERLLVEIERYTLALPQHVINTRTALAIASPAEPARVDMLERRLAALLRMSDHLAP